MHRGHRYLIAICFAFAFGSVIAFLSLAFPFTSPSTISYAQDGQKVQSVQILFVPEEGCPAALTATRGELDLDPFGAPIDARIYLTYRNVSNRAIAAVKFRIRFTDNNGKDLGTFQAPDGAFLEAGQERTQKWKADRVYQGTTALKVRILMVKYADGNLWESAKVKEIPSPSNPQGR